MERLVSPENAVEFEQQIEQRKVDRLDLVDAEIAEQHVDVLQCRREVLTCCAVGRREALTCMGMEE